MQNIDSDNNIENSFNCRLAVDAIAKCRQLRGGRAAAGNQTEEYFGSSDTDSGHE